MDDLTVIQEWPRSAGLSLRGERSNLLHKLQPAVMEHWQFFTAFLRKPFKVGAVVPSSLALARVVLQDCPLSSANTVVELGAGTGAFTRLILERMSRGTKLIALELDGHHTKSLRRRFPQVEVYHDSAEHIKKYLTRHGRKKADCIISGLPWGNMPSRVQDRIIEAVFTCLKPGGVFSSFAYLHACWFPSSRRFRQRLEAHFSKVTTSRIIWRNLPPAYVYRCR